MTLASRFPSTSRAGGLLRLPLRLIPPASTVRVVRGPLRGARWVVGSSTHGCWLGSYEMETQHHLAKLLRPGQVFYDVGANVGFYTLLGARRVGPAGRVVAFEPVPSNVAALRRHVALNDITNVTVVQAAVGAEPGLARFAMGASNSMGRLAGDGEVVVDVVAIDALVASGAVPPPQVIKIDVEGFAGDVLAGAARVLEAERPVLFLALHDEEEQAACEKTLAPLGYCRSLLDTSGGGWVCVPAGRC